jgi:ABC-2 type transport system permease protein
MFSTFLRFEWRHWLRAPMPWTFLFIFAFFTGAATVSDSVTIGGSFGNIHKNAPFVIQNWYAVFSLLALLLATAFMNSAALRDFERNAHQIVFSKPIGKASYYFGHFTGGWLASLVPMTGVSIGAWAGTGLNSVFQWLDASRFGESGLTGHLEGFLVFVIPNSILIGGIVYAVAANTRSTMYSFVTAVAIMMGYIFSGVLTQNLEQEMLAGMLDPFGFTTYDIMTKYWTVDQKNNSALGLSGLLLYNRLLWTGVGLLALYLGYLRFNFAEKSTSSSSWLGRLFSRKKAQPAPVETAGLNLQFGGALPRVAPQLNSAMQWSQLWSQVRTEWRFVVRSTPFIILSLLGVLNSLGALLFASEAYDTHELPVTYTMINAIRGSFYLFMIIVMVYFTGALVWKERNARVEDIVDALPAKNWTAFLGKYLALMGALMLLQLLVIGVAILCQAKEGFSDYNLGLYVRELLLMDMLGFAFSLALAFLIQALSPNMYLGFFIFIAFLLASNFGLKALDWASNMVEFGGLPKYTLSDFYGYAPFKNTLSWFSGYWGLFSSLLGLTGILFWVRGRERGWRGRFRMASLEWNNYKGVAYVASFAWIGVAAWVFYNTKIENKIISPKQQERRDARYEKDYKQLSNVAQPRIYDVKYDITLEPAKRSLALKGKYMVRNNRSEALDSLLVNVPRIVDFTLGGPRLQLLKDDEEVRFRIYKIEPALAPGDSMVIEFNSNFVPKGFPNEVTFSRLVQNGTFFDNTEVAPIFGYAETLELSDKNLRKKYDLPEKTRRPLLNRADTLNRMNGYISLSGDFVNVETVFRTAPDQIAIAPGSLQREWNEGGYRCFHYKLDHPSFNFYSFMSANYEVKKQLWNGISMEVYYHRDHGYNVDRMMNAIQHSLDYFIQHFGPYEHKQCRIIEFPRFSDFAQAFPGSMPYSEGIGFIQDFKSEKEDIDMVTKIVAHEIAHQWWGHQACGADMQGAEMLVESFAQYSSLMVMEHMHGASQTQKFLKHEMDRYLRGRSRETLRELPLMRCENQGYIHYQKGTGAMYALKEAIGEDRVNTALRNYLQRYRYKAPLYPVSLDAVDEFYAQTPDSLRYVLKDWFEEITIYDNRCEQVDIKELPDGKFEVTVSLSFKKFKADDQGKNTEVPLDEYIEIGATAKPKEDGRLGNVLLRQKVRVTQPDMQFTFTLNERPDRAGVDPFGLLPDLGPEDNLK